MTIQLLHISTSHIITYIEENSHRIIINMNQHIIFAFSHFELKHKFQSYGFANLTLINSDCSASNFPKLFINFISLAKNIWIPVYVTFQLINFVIGSMQEKLQ